MPMKYLNKIIHGDCLTVMKDLPSKFVDLVVTDPPYGISKEMKISRNKNTMKFKGKDINYNFGEWDNIEDVLWFTFNWIDEVDRVLKDDSVFVLFFDRDKINYVADYCKGKGYKRRNYIYYVKKNPVPQARKINWMSSVEQGIILTKGKHHYNYTEGQHKEDWSLPICSGKERTEHPTQKPLQIFQDVCRWWSFENDIVLDPFLGSGTTAISCMKTKRNFIGIEKEAKYVEIAQRRIDKELSQLKLAI